MDYNIEGAVWVKSLIIKLTDSLMTKFNSPKKVTDEEFITFILVLFSNTNLGDNTETVKIKFVEFYSFFSGCLADLRCKRRAKMI